MSTIGIERDEYKKLCETVMNMKSVMTSDKFTEHEKIELINDSLDTLERNLY